MKPVKHIILSPHRLDCRLRGDWCCEETTYLRRDSLGRKNKRAFNNFLVFRCNDPQCEARVAFLMNDVRIALGIPAKWQGGAL